LRHHSQEGRRAEQDHDYGEKELQLAVGWSFPKLRQASILRAGLDLGSSVPVSTFDSPARTDMEAPPLERKLAAILAADVEGYSRLMHADEERTLATLTGHRNIVDDLIAAAHGQIFGTAGDSVLAGFPSVVEAFYCAVAIQQALMKANAALAEGARMYFRIGINVGDVMVKDGDIFGDGVNIAVRVEALADPGGICITRGVRDHLRDRVDTVFEDLGEQSAKNIARPVRVFRAVFDPNAEPSLPLNRDLPSGAADRIEGAEPPSADVAEIAFWESVQASDDDAEYEIYLEHYPVGTYLKKYPQGEFESLASILLANLDHLPR
jgi:class 3 adenylate cyclase